MLLVSVPQLSFKVSVCSHFAIVCILPALHCYDRSVNIDIISLYRGSLSCREPLISSACACMCLSIWVRACAHTTALIAGTEVISPVKQVLKRQGTLPMFASERTTEIGVIFQSLSQTSVEDTSPPQCDCVCVCIWVDARKGVTRWSKAYKSFAEQL